eukprot:TRINITY_DN11972_c0_g1_i1.p1 TRINITY_DN11972_c0_g1~~TRINITY_DN11972_c0_g1_i1.p1  ORF type:complete len:743 (-),score=109.29 TRINITY_DN11972_c0_g1_i1:13-2241(-)
MANRVLIVGGSGAGKKRIIDALLTAGFGSSMGGTEPPEIMDHPYVLPERSCSVVTKYYTCDVHFYLVRPEAMNDTQHQAAGDEQIFHRFHAVVLVAAEDDPESLSNLQRFVSHFGPLPADVCILAHNTRTQAPKTTDSEARRQAMQEWALDNGFEVVDVPFQDGLAKAEPTEDISDKEGIERICEALVCTRWPEFETVARTTAKPKKTEPEKTAPNRILLVGANSEAWRDSALAVLFPPQESLVDTPEPVNGAKELCCAAIRTKYYIAEISTYWLELAVGSGDLEDPLDNRQTEFWAQFHAVVLLFRLAELEAFDRFCHLAQKCGGFRQTGVTLCVGLHTPAPAPLAPHQYRRMAEWCCENGFEFIVGDLPDPSGADPAASAAAAAAVAFESATSHSLSADNRKSGFDRVREAFRFTRWPTLQAPPPPPPLVPVPPLGGSPNRVLLVGAAGSGKKFLMQQMFGFNLRPSQIQAAPFASGSLRFGVSLSNKYYRADVEFYVLNPASVSVPDAPLLARQEFWRQFTAVALVVDSRKPNDWEGIVAFANVVGDDCVGLPLTRLVVTNHCAGDSPDIVKDWCVQHLFEDVCVPSGGFFAVPPRSTNGPFAELQGAQRVLECLNSTLWADMQPNESVHAPTAVASLRIVNSSNKPTQSETPAPATERVVAPTVEPANTVPKTEVQEQALPTANEEEVEGQLEDFDDLMQQVLQLRSAGAGLSDDARRDRASALAMRMMQLLGDDDDE